MVKDRVLLLAATTAYQTADFARAAERGLFAFEKKRLHRNSRALIPDS